MKSSDLTSHFDLLVRRVFEPLQCAGVTVGACGVLRRGAAGDGCAGVALWNVGVGAKGARGKKGAQKWVLFVEGLRNGEPRNVRNAVLRLKHCMEHARGRAAGTKKSEPRLQHGLLLAPFISEGAGKICEDAGISYADLAGNARVAFGTVFISVRSPEAPRRERRELQSLFTPRATRMLRVLLNAPHKIWKVAELAGVARVSLGWASALRQKLAAKEWASLEADGFRITRPDAVLDAWAGADDWEKRTRIEEYSVPFLDPEELAAKLQNALRDDPPVFTQWFAGWLRHPHTTPVIVSAYVRQFPSEAEIARFAGRRVSEGGRLRLIVPKDEGVFDVTQAVQGFALVSDAQIYVDLLRAGQRGEEQAGELRKWADFSGGWNNKNLEPRTRAGQEL